MASLQELLAEEGFRRRSGTKPRKKKENPVLDESVSLPVYICHDKRSIGLPSPRKGSTRRSGSSSQLSSVRTQSSVVSSRRTAGPKLERVKTKSMVSVEAKVEQPALDDAAVSAVISILGGYIGRFFKDAQFRSRIRAACQSCLSKEEDVEDEVFNDLEMGMENIDELAESSRSTRESKMKMLRNSIRLLGIVESLNSPESKNGFTCGISNSHLSACAQLYLSIVYKLERNDRVSARHLLQVFFDSPSLARRHMLPDLWEHFFLPHLLHLKVWFTQEAESIAASGHSVSGRRMSTLRKMYNDQLDKGTIQFALYYKEWLKVGVRAPVVPVVTLPSKINHELPEKGDLNSNSSETPINKRLYQAIFGSSIKRVAVVSVPNHNENKGVLVSEEARQEIPGDRKSINSVDREVQGDMPSMRMLGKPKDSSLSAAHRPDYFRFLSRRNLPEAGVSHCNSLMQNEARTRVREDHSPLSNLKFAVKVICNTESLIECEVAIRIAAKVWMDSHGDTIVQTSLSKVPVIEGLLEMLYASEDIEVMELAIAILAELVSRNETNRQIVLALDPQLEIFMRLLKNHNVFLKASVLLYLLKPKAKQMSSPNWAPLLLKVLEYGDRLQSLFTIQCSPHSAVFYLLDQLMTGFDKDQNVENSKQIIMLGGLKLLIKMLQVGEVYEKKTAVFLLYLCIQADGNSRHYVANNMNKDSLIELLMDHNKSAGYALALLMELICLTRRTHVNNFLKGLMSQGSLNIMHILLVYLQRAPQEQRPVIAVILFQLDLLGDPSQSSLYREEAIDALVEALECNGQNEVVQEQLARALSLLAGRFFHSGKPSVESWLLRQALFPNALHESFAGKGADFGALTTEDEEEKVSDGWQRKAATILVNSSQGFIEGLSKSMAKGSPSLSRACLVTITWISNTMISIQNASLKPMAFSVILPNVLEMMNYDKNIEEKVLATLTLWSLSQNSEILSKLAPLRKNLEGLLENISQVTWTAKELLSLLGAVPTL